MRAVFTPADDPNRTVGEVAFDGRAVTIASAPDEEARAALQRVFRPAAIVVDDPALRPAGASGESVLQPGGQEWFRAAVAVRAAEEGLKGRLAPEGWRGGWDPAAAYRTFREDLRRRAAQA